MAAQSGSLVAAHGHAWAWQQRMHNPMGLLCSHLHRALTLQVNFNWDCDLDGSVHACIPSVSMLRLDDPNNPLSTGYNFRYATYSRFLNASSGSPVESRDLKKVYGLRFVFLNAGQGRSFDWATIVKAVGSTVALLGIATVLADCAPPPAPRQPFPPHSTRTYYA